MAGLISYRRVLPVGGSEILSARGLLIVFHEGQGALTVTAIQNQLSGHSGESFTLDMHRRDQWRFDQEFDSVRIENNTDLAMSVELFIGYGIYVLAPPEIPIGDVFSSRGPLVIPATGERILAYDARRYLAKVRVVPNGPDGIVKLAGNRADAIAGNALKLQASDSFDDVRKAQHLTGVSHALPVHARGELWGASANLSVYVQEFAYTYNVPDSEHPGPVDPVPPDNPAPPPPVGLTFQMTVSGSSSTGPYQTNNGTSYIQNYGSGFNGEPVATPSGQPGGDLSPAPPLYVNGAQLVVWGSVGEGPNWWWTVCVDGVHPQDFFTSVDFETQGNGHKQLLTADADFNVEFTEAGYTIWAWPMPFTGTPPDLPAVDTDVLIA